MSLDELRERIEGADLVPSRESLLDGIGATMEVLEQHGITTLAGLRDELKSSKRLAALAQATCLDPHYLILLRREIQSYFPKPPALIDFNWLPETAIVKLREKGVRHAAALYEAANSVAHREALARSTGVDAAVLESLVRLADLTRVQWVSPTAARMLVEAGYDGASKVATADAADLCEALTRVKRGDRFFKGQIGLRDIQRLVRAARYVAGCA